MAFIDAPPRVVQCSHRYRVTKTYRDERYEETFVAATCELCGDHVSGRFVLPAGARAGMIHAID